MCSLEALNIIQLGKSSHLTRKYYPEDLVEDTGFVIKEIPDFFTNDQDFYSEIFDVICFEDQKIATDMLAEEYLKVYKSKNPFKQFFYTVVKTFVSEMLFKRNPDISRREIGFNNHVIWPLLIGMSQHMLDTKFSVGEIRLRPMRKELRLELGRNNLYYNADGIFHNSTHDVKIAILETTGSFSVRNNSREAYDYLKAGYGLISMLHYIGRTYCYGNFDTFTKLVYISYKLQI